MRVTKKEITAGCWSNEHVICEVPEEWLNDVYRELKDFGIWEITVWETHKGVFAVTVDKPRVASAARLHLRKTLPLP